MGNDNSYPNERSMSRRSYMAAGSAVGAMAVAGCLGDDDDDDGDDVGDDDDDDVDRPEVVTDAEEIDRDDPDYPIRSDALYAASLRHGSEGFFEAMDRREEVRYGPSPPPRTPEDDGDIIDIDTLEFNWTAGEGDPAGYFEDLAPILEALEENVGVPVNGNMFDDRTAMVEARRAHNLHVGQIGTGTMPYSIALADTYPLTIGLNPVETAAGDEFMGAGYRITSFVPMDGDVWGLEDYEGKTIGLAHEGSFSGGQAPPAVLNQEQGFDEDDYEINWAGTHEAGYIAMLAGDADCTMSASTSVWRLDGDVDWTDTACVWQSDPVPAGMVGYINVLPEEIKDGIDETFLEGDFSGTSFVEEHGGYTRFMEQHYPTHFDIVLQVHEFMETDFERLEDS